MPTAYQEIQFSCCCQLIEIMRENTKSVKKFTGRFKLLPSWIDSVYAIPDSENVREDGREGAVSSFGSIGDRAAHTYRTCLNRPNRLKLLLAPRASG